MLLLPCHLGLFQAPHVGFHLDAKQSTTTSILSKWIGYSPINMKILLLSKQKFKDWTLPPSTLSKLSPSEFAVWSVVFPHYSAIFFCGRSGAPLSQDIFQSYLSCWDRETPEDPLLLLVFHHNNNMRRKRTSTRSTSSSPDLLVVCTMR